MWRPQSRYTVSRIECRITFPQNQRCRAKIALHPPKSRWRTFLRTPPSHFPLIRSRQGPRGSDAAGWWRVLQHLILGSENGSCYRGVSRLQSHQSRYSVQPSFPSPEQKKFKNIRNVHQDSDFDQRAKGAILEHAFFGWLRFLQGRGGSEILPGNWNLLGLIGAFSGLIGAFSGPIRAFLGPM